MIFQTVSEQIWVCEALMINDEIMYYNFIYRGL